MTSALPRAEELPTPSPETYEELRNFTTLIGVSSRDALTPVYLLLDRLQKDTTDPLTSQRIGWAKRSAIRLAKLAELLVEEVRQVDSGAVVKDVLAAMRAGGATLPTTVQVERLPPLRARELALGQLFRNLFENLLSVRRAGAEIELQVDARERDSHWEFGVEGRGDFAPEKQWQGAFDPSVRAGEGGTFRSGLDLSLCRAIVELHGGEIWVGARSHSEHSFRFALPK